MLDVYSLRRAYQTGRWSWAPDYSFLLLPTGSLNVSGHVHRLCVHLDCSASYYSWHLSHPAMQGTLGKKKITTIRLIKLWFWILFLKWTAAENVCTTVVNKSLLRFSDHKRTKQQTEPVTGWRDDKDWSSVRGNKRHICKSSHLTASQLRRSD